jgi:plastocyanin
VADASGNYPAQFCKVGGETPCSNPASITGGTSGKLTVKFDAAGTYNFRCDFHPTQMTGKFQVQ